MPRKSREAEKKFYNNEREDQEMSIKIDPVVAADIEIIGEEDNLTYGGVVEDAIIFYRHYLEFKSPDTFTRDSISKMKTDLHELYAENLKDW